MRDEQEDNDNQLGDKVEMLLPERGKRRGVVVEMQTHVVRVQSEDGVYDVARHQVRNFSAAARKAWKTRPERGVGRPTDPARPRKRMVSLRLSEATWAGLGQAVRRGLITSREAAVNEWLAEKLAELDGYGDSDERD